MLIWKAHEKKVRSLAFSPDGTRIATTESDSSRIALWTPLTGKLVGELNDGHTSVGAIDFFPDGRHIAASFETAGIRVWNVESGKNVTTLHGHSWHSCALAVSPDGSRLLTATNDGILEWNDPLRLTFGFSEPGCTFPFLHRGPTRIGFSPAGTYFCIAEWYMHLLKPSTLKEIRQFRDPTPKSAEGAGVKAFAFTRDESRLALALGQRAVVWSPADPEANPVLIAGHGKNVMAVGFLPDGTVLTAGMDGTARVWDSNTGAELRSFDWGIGKVRVAAVSPDGTLCAAGSDDGHIVVWDVDF